MAWILYRKYKDGTLEWRETSTGDSIVVENIGNGRWELSRGLNRLSINGTIFRSKSKAIASAKALMKLKRTKNDFKPEKKGVGWFVAFEQEQNPKSDMVG